MYQPYRWRPRRHRFVALAKYAFLFILFGGVVILTACDVIDQGNSGTTVNRAEATRDFTLTSSSGFTRKSEVVRLVVDNVWDGDGDADFKYKSPKSPYIIYWEFAVTSSIGSAFAVYFVPTDKDNLDYRFSRGLGDPGIPVIPVYGNHGTIFENGRGEFVVRAAGVDWTLYALVDP